MRTWFEHFVFDLCTKARERNQANPVAEMHAAFEDVFGREFNPPTSDVIGDREDLRVWNEAKKQLEEGK